MIEVIDAYVVPDKFLYICDPAKNTGCKKTICQTDCFYTTKRACRVSDQKFYVNPKTHNIEPWNHGRG